MAPARASVGKPLTEKVIGYTALSVEYAVRVAPLVLIAVAVFFGGLKLWQSAEGKDYFIIKPSVELESVSHNSALVEYRRLGAYAAGRSLLDPLLLRDLKLKYLQSPWVREVCSLRRVFPDKVLVEFIPREPFAQVLSDGYYWVVDDEGMLLPVAGTRKARAGLAVMRGDIRNRPKNGEYWNDQGIIGGVRALNLLRKSAVCDSLPVREIVLKRAGFIDRLSNPGRSRPRMMMYTTNGYSVDWGTVSEDFPGEMSSQEKIALLRQLVAQCPQSGREGICFDVRTKVAGYSLNNQR